VFSAVLELTLSMRYIIPWTLWFVGVCTALFESWIQLV